MRVQLVDEQNDSSFARRDFLEERLQPVLEFAAILRAGDHRAEVHRDELLVLQAFRHVAAHDAPRETFHDRRLAHARFADEHRIVFRAPREHLHHAADFFVASDDRIDLSLPRQRREVAPIFFERLEFPFGFWIGHALVAAEIGQSAQDFIARNLVRGENSFQRRAAVA